jgi:hypothetical protein
MPSEPLSMCSVCGRPIPPKDYNGLDEGVCLVTDGRRCRESAVAARLTAESRLAEALEALRRVGCLRYTSEFPAPCKPEDEDTCSRCRGLWAGTPPGPAPSQSGSNGFQRAAPVSRDAVLEDAMRAIEAEAAGWRDSRILNAMSLAIEAVRLLKTKEPA